MMKPGVELKTVETPKEIALIRRAAELRSAHLEAYPHQAWRLINGPGDGAPAGLSADIYGDFLLVTARLELASERVDRWCDALFDAYSPSGLILKRLGLRPSECTTRLYRGVDSDGPIAIVEAGATLLCTLNEDVATGLYLDLHDVRAWFGQQVQGATVLNLFSYTCSFSVHAVHGGAARVTSVDVSKKALRRGRENMAANGFDADQHRWFADDALSYLQRAVKRGGRFDWIILDPPAFGRAGNKRFALKKDLSSMLEAAIQLLADDGRLLLSVHTAGYDHSGLWDEIQRCGALLGRSIGQVKTFGLPEWDHPVLGNRHGDRGDYLQVLVVQAKSA
jgi:23S rRNA (cytosine1962-C5)-methyltransferase